MATRYFGLLDPEFRTVTSAFRIRTTADGLYVERWDPPVRAWMPGPGTLLRFVNDGEIGAEEISEEEARALIARGLPALPAPV